MITRNIGFDFGYGRIKGSDNFGNKVEFPTFMKLREATKTEAAKNQKYVIEIDGNRFAVGSLARAFNPVREWNEEQSLVKDNINVFLGTVLFLVSDLAGDNTDNEIEHINLAVGLPVDYYNDQKEKMRKVFEGLELEIKMYDTTKTFVIDYTLIAQQGVGAFSALSLDIDGQMKDDIDSRLSMFGGALVDIGYRTVDYLRVVIVDGRFIIHDEKSGSLDNSGIVEAHKKATNNINNDLGLDNAMAYYEKAMEQNDGNIPFGEEITNVKKYFDKGYQELANDIVQKLALKWADINTFGNLYLTGGGASVLAKYLDFKTTVVVQEEASFANTFGYLGLLALSVKNNTTINY